MIKGRFFQLCSLILLLFTSCDNELTELILEEDSPKNGLVLYEARLTDFPELPSLLENTINEQKTSANKLDDKIYDFDIDSTSVSKVVSENGISYTFAITREHSENGIFENLVISEKDSIGTRAFLIKYQPDNDYLRKLEQGIIVPFFGRQHIIELDNNKLLTSKSSCYEITEVRCSNSQHQTKPGDETEHGTLAGPGCTEPYVESQVVCFDADSGSTGDSGDIGIPVGGGSTTIGGGGGIPGWDNSGGDSANDILNSDFLTKINIPYGSILKTRMNYSSNFTKKARYIDNPQNKVIVEKMVSFLNMKNDSPEAIAFIDDVMDKAITYGDVQRTALEAFLIVHAVEQGGVHYSEVDSIFTDILNNYNSFNINSTNNTETHIWFMLRCTELKALHPEWSEYRVLWEASKEFIHLTLDVLGLVPGVGEAADLVNGAIYFAEGDNLNGTLSLSAAIPFAGWSATGSKWAIKVAKLANGKKIALQLTKNTNGLLDFGRKSSDLFRKQLGLVKGDGMIGHHVIPWNLNDHPVVQAAANFKWHPHDASINGKAVSAARHNGSHNSYDKYVRNRLQGLQQYVNNPERAYQELKKLSDELQDFIDANPTKKIKELY